jgi:branched-chain amino acid aminotransferase
MKPELFSDKDGVISKNPPMVSLLDHGFLFGDSLYDVVRLYDGRLFGWDEHCERLVQSGKRISLDVASLLPEIKKRVYALLKEYNQPNAACRIFITRGVGNLHINPESCKEPAIYLATWKLNPSAGPSDIRLAVPKMRRNSIRSLDPAIKSGNYLNNIIAHHEALQLGYDDALMLNPEEKITELPTSNLAWIRDAKLRTSSLDSGILHGITRKIFVESMNVEEGQFGIDELRAADEVFVLSTLKEIISVSEIRFEDGSVQKYTERGQAQALQKKFKEILADKLKAVDPIL